MVGLIDIPIAPREQNRGRGSRFRTDQQTAGFGSVDFDTRSVDDANWDTTAVVGYDAATQSWSVVQRYVYSPYGSLTILNADFSTPAAGTQPMTDYLYQGMSLDPVTGLYYERNRNYSPSLGVWTSQDPLQYINGANTYQFVGSDPVGMVDASGLLSPCDQRALNKLSKALNAAKGNFLKDVSRDEIEGTQIALDQNAAGQLSDMTGAVLPAVGGFAGEAFQVISALSEAREAMQALSEFREVGPLFDAAYENANEGYSLAGALDAMEEGSLGSAVASAVATGLDSYAVFGNQAQALSAAYDSAFSNALDAVGGPAASAAYDTLSSIEGALNAAYRGAGPLSKYITPFTRALFAARVARAIRDYHKAMAQCGCGK